MIDWRSVFTKIGVPFAERGKNVGAGNINITCPFCGDDPSEHLAVALDGKGYYCYRDPRHAGKSPRYLLRRLGLSEMDIALLLAGTNTYEPQPRAKRPDIEQARKRWGYFLPVAESDKYLGYLESRGFSNPERVARQYDLRYDTEGKWAQRLLIPIAEDEGVITWTGRAVRTGLAPKYYVNPIEHPGFVYTPRPTRRVLVITEGPLDALKFSVAYEDRALSAVALMGKAISEAKLLRLSEMATDAAYVLVCLDNDCSVSEVYNFINELRPLVRCPIERLRLPPQYKDAGEMPIDSLQGLVDKI